jgi:hypothetical protein
MEERIILCAYGEASPFDRLVVAITCRRNPRVQALLTAHRHTARAFGEHRDACVPPAALRQRLLGIPITEGTPAKAASSPERSWLESFAALSLPLGAALAVILVASHFHLQIREQSRSQLALRQAKESIALIESLFTDAARSGFEQAIVQSTTIPLHQSVIDARNTLKETL